jgi:L-asparagine transporter-like permease
MNKIGQYWKSILAVVGLLLTLLTALSSVWGDDAPTWVPFVIAALTAVSVYRVPNADGPNVRLSKPKGE